jgi:hypothetical protein
VLAIASTKPANKIVLSLLFEVLKTGQGWVSFKDCANTYQPEYFVG